MLLCSVLLCSALSKCIDKKLYSINGTIVADSIGRVRPFRPLVLIGTTLIVSLIKYDHFLQHALRLGYPFLDCQQHRSRRGIRILAQILSKSRRSTCMNHSHDHCRTPAATTPTYSHWHKCRISRCGMNAQWHLSISTLCLYEYFLNHLTMRLKHFSHQWLPAVWRQLSVDRDTCSNIEQAASHETAAGV